MFKHLLPIIASTFLQCIVQAYVQDETTILLLEVHSPTDGEVKMDCIESNLGKNFPLNKNFEYKLAEASPVTGCEAVERVEGATAYLIDRGDCMFAEKVANIENQVFGSVAIVSNDREGEKAFAMHQINGREVTVRIPACMVTYEDGELLRDLMSSSNTVDIKLSHKPAIEVNYPNSNRLKFAPGETLDIRWTSSHNKPIKLTLQQGHASQAAQTWEISSYVPPLSKDEGYIPGTYRKEEKPKLRKVQPTQPPTATRVCETIDDAMLCEDSTDADCTWDDDQCMSSTSPPTASPTTAEDADMDQEAEYEEYMGYEYEYVPGTTVERTFSYEIPRGLPADRFYVVRFSFIGHEENYSDSEYFTISGESSFTILQPSSRGVILYLGEEYTAKWSTELDKDDPEDEADEVKLSLMSYDFKTKSLDTALVLTPEPIQNVGEYTFTVPEDLPLHGNYYLRLDNAKLTMFSYGNYFFRIDKGAIFVNPSAFQERNEPMRIGTEVEILWESVGKLDKVDITLVKDSDTNFHLPVGQGLPNSGTFTWTVPDSVVAGVGYRFKVTDPLDLQKRVAGESEQPFAITDARFSLDLVSPDPSELVGGILFTNQRVQIKWRVNGEMPQGRTLDVIIVSDDGSHEEVVGHAIPVEALVFGWQVPPRFVIGSAERQVFFGVSCAAEGIRTVSQAPIRVVRSSFHLLPTLDALETEREKRDPHENSWLDPLDRSFNLAWSIIGRVAYVYVEFRCWPVAGEHHPEVRLVMKADGSVHAGVTDRPSASGYFEAHAIPAQVNGRLGVQGWLPQEIPVNGAMYRHEMQCSCRVENALDVQQRDDIVGLALGPATTSKEWKTLVRQAKVVAEADGWKKLRHPKTLQELYYQPTTGQAQYEPPAGFRAQLATDGPLPAEGVPSVFYVGAGGLAIAAVSCMLMRAVPGLCQLITRPCRMWVQNWRGEGPSYRNEVGRRPSIIAGLLTRRKSSLSSSGAPDALDTLPVGDERRFSLSNEEEETMGLQMAPMSWNQDWSTIAMEEGSTQRTDMSLPEPPAMPPGMSSSPTSSEHLV